MGNFETSINNTFLAYIFYILDILIKYLPLILIIFIGITLIILNKSISKDKYSLSNILHTLFQIVIGILISTFIAYVVLISIAFLELNIFTVILNNKPDIIGVKTNTQEIYDTIKQNNRPPEIITTDKNSKKITIATAKAAGGTSNFYGDKILNGVPEFLILPNNKDVVNLLLLDNTLVVSGISVNDMEKISPLIGYLIVKNYFPLRQIKSLPKVNVMNENEYLVFRKNDATEKIKMIDIEIKKMGEFISSVSASIKTSNEELTNISSRKELILKQRNKEHNECLSEGTYKARVFTPKNTKEFCQRIIDEWEDDYIYQKNIESNLTKKIETDQQKLKEYQFYDNYFKAQKKLNNISTENIPSELGIFEPTDSIKIVIINSSGENIADFFETLSHEYLHYASYVPGKRLDSSFFEEGLTEYFARKSISDSLKRDSNIGYPTAVKIIEELMKKNLESDFTDIYFTKNQKLLEEKLDLVYGKDFYKNNIVLFESLLYTSDEDQLLEIANTLMRKIGGESFTSEDILSDGY